MQKYGLLMFDMDGTFLDSARYHLRAYQRFFRKYGITIDVEKEINHFGTTIDEMLDILGVPGEEKEDIYRRMDEFYRTEVNDLIREIPLAQGAEETFRALQARGYRMSVVTNTLHPEMQNILSLRGLDQYFVAMQGATPDESGKENRCAEILRALCPDGNALYIGDAARDIEIAHDLHCDSCLAVTDISWARNPQEIAARLHPTYVIHSLCDLQEILD